MTYFQRAPLDAQGSHLDVSQAQGMLQIDLQPIGQRRIGIQALVRSAAVLLPPGALQVALHIRQIFQRRLRRSQVQDEHGDRRQDGIRNERNHDERDKHAPAHAGRDRPARQVTEKGISRHRRRISGIG